MPQFPDQSRLIAKEVALGTIRALEPPQDHIGLSYVAPWKEVATDDVIFDYAQQMADGLAPARAEDAEAELAQKDVMLGGTGRASIMDWALKDHYSPSDVARFREALLVAGNQNGENTLLSQLPLTVGSTLQDLQTKFAKDDALRRKKLDNRVEWLIMTAVDTGGIAYNDGKVQFSVDFGRPANQHNQAPAGDLWNLGSCDPIGDIQKVVDWMYEKYGVVISRAIASRKVLQNVWNSERFIARFAPMLPAPGSAPVDPAYLVNGWNREMAVSVLEQATGVKFKEYDAVYKVRNRGTQTTVNHRFLSDKKVYLLPDEASLDELDDTGIGFAKTLTSPHPEGNWSPGFYEWEQDTKDPWGTSRGTGVKAFPIFLHMEKTYSMVVLP
jgi:hypothetical protein